MLPEFCDAMETDDASLKTIGLQGVAGHGVRVNRVYVFQGGDGEVREREWSTPSDVAGVLKIHLRFPYTKTSIIKCCRSFVWQGSKTGPLDQNCQFCLLLTFLTKYNPHRPQRVRIPKIKILINVKGAL